MRNSIVFCVVLVAAASATPRQFERIVGGSLTTINQYPDMAALLRSPGTTGHRQDCGGAIISNRAILTAAHCTSGDAPANWRSRIGSTFANSGGTVLNTQLIVNHHQYNRFSWDNDIAIIRVASNIIFSNVVRLASVAGANFNVPNNGIVWAAGWGSISFNGPVSEQLRHVQVWKVPHATCRQRYATIGLVITNNMICSGWLDVGGRDQCTGDSGGPLYHNGVVVGVSSFGADCGHPFFPGVNTRVNRYSAWINQNA